MNQDDECRFESCAPTWNILVSAPCGPPTRDADKRVSDARGPTRSARACLEDTVSVLILPSPTSLTPEISSVMSIPEVSRTHSVDNLKNV